MSGIQLRLYLVPGTKVPSSAEEFPHWWRSSSLASSPSSSSPSSCYWYPRVNRGRRLVVSCKSASRFPSNDSWWPGNRRRDRDRGNGNHGEYIEAFLLAPGEFAMERLITTLQGEREESPDQFDFMKDVVEALGYEIRMVRITERIVNTYRAHIDIGKAGEQGVLSLDSRPSDAINLARRCKAPIYVNQQIVSTDAIQVVYGRWKGKSTYDVLLDSAEGPDPVSEELSLVRKMNLAATEERYKDAASWRDKLNKFRLSQYEP